MGHLQVHPGPEENWLDGGKAGLRCRPEDSQVCRLRDTLPG